MHSAVLEKGMCRSYEGCNFPYLNTYLTYQFLRATVITDKVDKFLWCFHFSSGKLVVGRGINI